MYLVIDGHRYDYNGVHDWELFSRWFFDSLLDYEASQRVEHLSGKGGNKMGKIEIKLTRTKSWPVNITPETPENEIETILVDEKELKIENGVRYYPMICGHGVVIGIKVE